ncbi:putative serine carboxypeptidase [Pseudocercospora fuligena]|uniref:Carboxypeptidase n=1 Tax=Pseudocercospora fuligena TaxID=685502 RepID=A0A8H6RGB4_9PEZI|nr:putative serine carboxypeptidase [Pseudocercospora fuligena]
MAFKSVLLVLFIALNFVIAAQHPYQVPRRYRFDRPQYEERHNIKRSPSGPPASNSTNKFLTSKTEKFAVNGSAIPEVDFDMGESENGPFTWMGGTAKPVRNAYDWRNLTNVLWIEQPVGMGFTQGNVSITDEDGLAKQFVGFYEQFIKTFDIQGYGLYLTGESYAGIYIPYIGAEVLARNCSDYTLKGIIINDPLLSDVTTGLQIMKKDFWFSYQNLYGFNTTTLVNVTTRHLECQYDTYIKSYFTFPPPQKAFPILPNAFSDRPQIERCDIHSFMSQAAELLNPCFNIYHITETCPYVTSALGGDGKDPKTAYFNRTDVQAALHVPENWAWTFCAPEEKPVFLNAENRTGMKFGLSADDQSAPVGQTDVLTRIIEATNNVIIGGGNIDADLAPNSTLLSLQNITWNGFQGFKEYPNQNSFYVPSLPYEWNFDSLSISGIVGSWGHERGLTFFQVTRAGHMVPADAPGAYFRLVELMLGRIGSLSERRTFTSLEEKVPKNESESWDVGFLVKEDEGVPVWDAFEVEEMVRKSWVLRGPATLELWCNDNHNKLQ